MRSTPRLVPAGRPADWRFDHGEIINRALTDLRSALPRSPDPDHLLGETFTLRQLRRVHEAVDGQEIGPDKLDTFRRRMQEKLVRPRSGAGRVAAVRRSCSAVTRCKGLPPFGPHGC